MSWSMFSFTRSRNPLTIGLIRRMCRYLRDVSCVKALYCSLIRPILEYASIVWCPSQAVWISKLERVQQYFTRVLILGFFGDTSATLPCYLERTFIAGLLLDNIDAPSLHCPALSFISNPALFALVILLLPPSDVCSMPTMVLW